MGLLDSASTIKSSIDDSMARQQEWGTDNAFINASTGHDMRGMSEGEIANDLLEGANISDASSDNISSTLAQGITRQGGNY